METSVTNPFPVDHSPDAAENQVHTFKAALLRHLLFTFAHDPVTATSSHWWLATCMAVRDKALAQSFQTMRQHRKQHVRRVHYLSLEYLMGRLLENNLRNTGLYEAAECALGEMGQSLETIINQEPDMGLGNGGLGRLAA